MIAARFPLAIGTREENERRGAWIADLYLSWDLLYPLVLLPPLTVLLDKHRCVTDITVKLTASCGVQNVDTMIAHPSHAFRQCMLMALGLNGIKIDVNVT